MKVRQDWQYIGPVYEMKVRQDWQYIGPVYEMKDQPSIFGTSWELPIMTKVTSKDGSKSKDMSVISPAPAGTADNKIYYFLGKFDENSVYLPVKQTFTTSTSSRFLLT